MNSKDIVNKYRDEGLVVLPSNKNSKTASVKWKKFQDTKPSDGEYNNWIDNDRYGNFALVLGEVSGSIGEIDVDVPDAKDFIKDAFSADKLKTVNIAVSSQGKIKIFCKAFDCNVSDEHVVSNKAYLKSNGEPKLPTGELRGYGGISIIPPSTHEDTKKEYYWYNRNSFKDLKQIDMKGLYDKIISSLRKKFDYKEPKNKHRIRTCFRKVIDNGVNLSGSEGHKFRVAVAAELINCHYPEDLIYKELKKVAVNSGERFDFKKTRKFIKHSLSKDYKKYSCRKLKEEFGEFVSEYCKGCKTTKNNEKEEHVIFKTNYTISDNLYLEEIIIDGKEMFVLYDAKNDSWEIIDKYELNGIEILPYPISLESRDSIIIPTGIMEYGSVSELRDEILKFAESEYDAGKMVPQYKLYATETMNTWICDKWQEGHAEKFMPILNARGASETGKKRFLTIMRWLTYHSVYSLATELIPSLFRTIAPFDGTLILDEADMKRSDEGCEFIRFLNSRADGVAIPRYNNSTQTTDWFKSFGMTVLATRKGYDDDGINSRMQVLITTKTERNDIALIPTKEFVKIGECLQKKLLLFRLRHMKGEMPSICTIANIPSFRVKEALLMIQELSKEDPRMLNGIQEIAEILNRQIVQDRALSKEGIILNSIYEILNEKNTSLEQKGKGGYKYYYIIQSTIKVWNKNNREYEELEDVPLTTGRIWEMAERGVNSRTIKRLWEGLGGQEIKPYKLSSGKTYRSILKIKNLQELRDAFPKYVVDYEEPELLKNIKKDKEIEDYDIS